MSGKGKPIHPQRNLNPALPQGQLAAGRIAQWNGQTWEPVNLAQAVQALIDSGDITITGGSGSVTSVGMILPKEFVSPVSGSPVTGSGTLEGVWLDEAANKIFAGPTSGAVAQPGFRSLVAADLPSGYTAIGQITCYGDGTEI